jgi:colanic acid/amylovoran biosynthesis protein
VFVPGGYFITPHDKHTYWLRHVLSVILASFLKRPVILYACSIGPFVGKQNRKLAKYALDRVDVIILREKQSLEYLRELGVSKPKIHETADVAFLLESCQGQRAKELFDKYIKVKGKLSIGFSVRPYDFPMEEDPLEKTEAYITAIARLADYAIQRHQARVFFVPQGLVGSYNDLSLSQDVVDRINQKENVHIISEDFSPQELKSLYSLMDLFVGVRMHANIFALGAQVPVLAIAYEPKTYGIMAELKLEDFVVDIRKITFEELRPRLDRLVADREKLKKVLASEVPRVMDKAAASGKIVAEFLRLRLGTNWESDPPCSIDFGNDTRNSKTVPKKC